MGTMVCFCQYSPFFDANKAGRMPASVSGSVVPAPSFDPCYLPLKAAGWLG
jgi:hypothetical protein